MSTDRVRQIFDVTDHMLGERAMWAELPDEAVSLALEEAVDTVMEAFASGPVPTACRAMEAVVADALRLWREWKDRVRDTGMVRIVPVTRFWRLLDTLAEERRKADPPPTIRLESVKLLHEQKVSARQIAMIYGFVDNLGRPEIWKVEEELAEPGKHTGPNSGWVNPVEKTKQEKEAKEQAALNRVTQLVNHKVNRESAPPPEALEDLVHQGVSVEQIVAMLGMTAQAVYAECDRQNLSRPKTIEEIRATAGPFSREPNEAEERIRAARHGEGKTATESEEKPTVSPEPVRRGPGRPKK